MSAQGRISRRRLVGTGIAAAGTVALPDWPVSEADARPSRRRARIRADVCIVGAGLSGLTAAYRLRQAGVGNVVVLEAHDRIGGRLLNHRLGNGKVVEAGGEWVGPTQTRLLALAKEIGVATFPQFTKGESVFFYGGKRQTYSGDIPPLLPTDLADFVQAQTRIEQLAQQVPLDAPWNARNADLLDGRTLEGWLLENTVTEGARFIFRFLFSIVLAVPPRGASLLFTLFYIHSAGGLDPLITTKGGAQDSRFVGGSQRVPLTLARRVGHRRIVLRSPVSLIDQRRRLIRVHSKRALVECRQVIVSVPAAGCRRIAFRPALPYARRMVQKNWQTGTGFKVHVVYDEPFWRADGLNGQCFSERGPLLVTFDNSPPDGSPGVLTGFLLPWSQEIQFGAGPVMDDPAARREAVLSDLATYYGPKARKPSRYLEKDWGAEKWIDGCESPRPPGLLTQYRSASRDRVGRVHWAGTDNSEIWESYMDGAVRAGERAAVEVREAL